MTARASAFDEISEKKRARVRRSNNIGSSSSNYKRAYVVACKKKKKAAALNALLMYGIYVNGAHDTVLALDLSGFS